MKSHIFLPLKQQFVVFLFNIKIVDVGIIIINIVIVADKVVIPKGIVVIEGVVIKISGCFSLYIITFNNKKVNVNKIKL